MLTLWTELRRAVRNVGKSPAFAAVAIASLSLGICANVTVYSVVREMILDDVSAWRPDRLAVLDGVNVSYNLYSDLRSSGAFQGLAFHHGIHDRIWHSTTNDIVWTLTTSSNFFDVLGIRASQGRLYSEHDAPSEMAVLSQGFWRKRLHSDPHVIGQPIQLSGRLYTVVGVLPSDYRSVYGHGVGVARDCTAAGRSQLAAGGVRSSAASSSNHDPPEAALRRAPSRSSAPDQEHGAGADRVPGEPDHIRRAPLPHAGTAQAAAGERNAIAIAGNDRCRPNP